MDFLLLMDSNVLPNAVSIFFKSSGFLIILSLGCSSCFRVLGCAVFLCWDITAAPTMLRKPSTGQWGLLGDLGTSQLLEIIQHGHGPGTGGPRNYQKFPRLRTPPLSGIGSTATMVTGCVQAAPSWPAWSKASRKSLQTV